MAQVVAKFRCSSTKIADYGENTGPASCEVELNAVTSSDPDNPNSQWSKWTPTGRITMTINNPAAYNKLIAGHEYLITFDDVTAQKATENKPA